MKMNRKEAYLGAAASALLLVTAGCQRAEINATTPAAEFQREGSLVVIPEQSTLRSRLSFDSARADTVQSQLSAPAVVEADPQRFANIFPPLSGRLLKLHVQLGDTVTNGQLLASLNSPDFFAAQGDYVKAKSAVNLTSRALKRQEELSEHKIAAQKDVEQAASDFEAAKSDLARQQPRIVGNVINEDIR